MIWKKKNFQEDAESNQYLCPPPLVNIIGEVLSHAELFENIASRV